MACFFSERKVIVMTGAGISTGDTYIYFIFVQLQKILSEHRIISPKKHFY